MLRQRLQGARRARRIEGRGKRGCDVGERVSHRRTIAPRSRLGREAAHAECRPPQACSRWRHKAARGGSRSWARTTFSTTSKDGRQPSRRRGTREYPVGRCSTDIFDFPFVVGRDRVTRCGTLGCFMLRREIFTQTGAAMRRSVLSVAGAGMLAWAMSVGAADAQPMMSAVQCPSGFKLIGKVCLSANQQTAQCLYSAAVGQPPKRGTTFRSQPRQLPAPSAGKHEQLKSGPCAR